jgi:fatty-acyl-CoA synthase
LRAVEAGAVFGAVAEHGVTHLCGAPVVLNLLLNAPASEKRRLDRTVEVMTAAAPPPATVIAAMEAMGFHITHVYGLTEVYGPAVVCAWHDEWSALPHDEQAAIKARQGVAYPVLEGLMVADPETLEARPADGETLGEVFMRGNITMKGYLKDPAATRDAFRGGWFHTGDLGVMHPDGYIEIRTARRTLSSRAARTSRPSRSKACCTGTRRCSKRPWSPGPTRSGARRRAPSSRSRRTRNR